MRREGNGEYDERGGKEKDGGGKEKTWRKIGEDL